MVKYVVFLIFVSVGVVHLPYHIMNSCCIEEGSNVNIELAAPPKGDFVKLRLHNSKEFSKLVIQTVLEKNNEQRLSCCHTRTNNCVTLYRVE